MVAPAGARREQVHAVFDDAGRGVVVGVAGLGALEVDVGVLGGAAQHRGVGGQAAGAKLEQVDVAQHGADVVVAEQGDLVDFVRGAKAVEEVQERQVGAQRRGVRDQGQVVGFLYRGGGQHRPARHAGRHDVAVIAEDRECVRGQGASRHVHDRRRLFAGDLEHVGDHEQQALRRGEGRREGALLQRAVQHAGGAGFGLHLDDVGHDAPQVGQALGRPVVGYLSHRGSRRDRIDRHDLAECIRDARGRLIAVETQPLLIHGSPFFGRYHDSPRTAFRRA